MNQPDYSSLRRRYSWYSVAALLFAPSLLNLGWSLTGSPWFYGWLPFDPFLRSLYETIVNSLSTVNEAFLMVAMMQLLVGWLWRPIGHTRWPCSGGMLVALWIGQSVRALGHWLGTWINGQAVYGLDWQDSLMMAALIPIGMLVTFPVLWLWLLAGSYVIRYRLVDLLEANQPHRYRVGRQWSIRGLMYLTTLIALLIVGHQALQQVSQWWFGGPPIDFSPWFLLIQIVSMGVTGLSVLWSAAYYRCGGSMWISYLVLIFVAALGTAVNWSFTQIAGPVAVNSLLPQMITQSAVRITLMFTFHLVIFRLWQRAGYKLQIPDVDRSAAR